MQIAPEIAFRGFEPDEELREAVRAEIDALGRFYERITTCRAMVEVPHRRHREGNRYHVRIEVSVPGRELVVSRDPGPDETLEDPFVALKEAFRAMARQVEDYARKVRGDVKRHEAPRRGTVWRLFPEAAPGDRYGFIREADGKEVYFHENSLLEAEFDDLEVGAEVRFAEEEGTEGPQASTVRLEGRQHPVHGQRLP